MGRDAATRTRPTADPLSAPDRLSLLHEGCDSLLAVGCNGVARDHFGHHVVRLGLPGFDLAVEANLAELERVTAQLRQLVYERHDLFVQPLARDRAVDQAPPLCGRRVDERPVSSISSACFRLTLRATATPGVEQKSPYLIPDVAKRQSSLAIARSHVATSWQPAAVATPCGAAITGTGTD